MGLVDDGCESERARHTIRTFLLGSNEATERRMATSDMIKQTVWNSVRTASCNPCIWEPISTLSLWPCFSLCPYPSLPVSLCIFLLILNTHDNTYLYFVWFLVRQSQDSTHDLFCIDHMFLKILSKTCSERSSQNSFLLNIGLVPLLKSLSLMHRKTQEKPT